MNYFNKTYTGFKKINLTEHLQTSSVKPKNLQSKEKDYATLRLNNNKSPCFSKFSFLLLNKTKGSM